MRAAAPTATPTPQKAQETQEKAQETQEEPQKETGASSWADEYDENWKHEGEWNHVYDYDYEEKWNTKERGQKGNQCEYWQEYARKTCA